MNFSSRIVNISFIILSLVIIRSLFVPSYSLNVPDYFKERVRKIKTGGITATGFNVKAPSGNIYMVTNFHFCIWSKDGSFETLSSTGNTKGMIIGASPKTDLCIATPFSNKYFNIESNDSSFFLKTAGFPSIADGNMTFSVGVTLGREERPLIIKEPPFPNCFPGTQLLNATRDYLECLTYDETMETTMYSYPGSSGSPVLNVHNRLVGIINSAGEMNRGHYVEVKKLLDLIEGFERNKR